MVKIVDNGHKGGIRLYRTYAHREAAIRGLVLTFGFNYFVHFVDVQEEYALQYGRAAWVASGKIYVNRNG